MRILHAKHLAVKWLDDLCLAEVQNTELNSVNTLFRGNSIASKAVDVYLKLTGYNYLNDTIGDIIRDIVDSRTGIEVDPSRLSNSDDVAKQSQKLLALVQQIWTAICRSAPYCPPYAQFCL